MNPANAARPFVRPAALLREDAVRQLVATEPHTSVIEYGAGALRNALYLQKLGCSVTVVELPQTRVRFARQYGAFERLGGRVLLQGVRPATVERYAVGVMTFVLETICEPVDRRALLRDCRKRLKPGGALAVSVRGPADVYAPERSGGPCSDGLITPQKTFVRAFTLRSITRLLRTSGFSRVERLNRTSNPKPRVVHVIAYR